MSRVGNKPVPIPKGVKVEIAGQTVKAKGPKGESGVTIDRTIAVAIEQEQVVVKRPDDSRASKALHGTARALIANMLHGVHEGYSRGLEIYGTGFSADVKGGKLNVNVGFMGRGVGKTAQFEIPIPTGLTVKVDVPQSRGNTEPAKFTVSGVDKQMVNQFAAEVRKIRKPEPYLGKGIRYAGEHIRRKAGKVFASGG